MSRIHGHSTIGTASPGRRLGFLAPRRSPLSRVATLALIASLPCFIAGGRAEGVRGTVISPGSAPFTETLDDMVRRDAENRTLTMGDDTVVRSTDRPPLPRIQAEPSQSGSTSRRSTRQARALLPEAPPLAPQTVASGFPTVSRADQVTDIGPWWIPPDTMGAIGPNHFMVVINGSVAVYARDGTRITHVSLNSFFTIPAGAITYPRENAFDPRVIYDRRSGRFFAITLERNNRDQNHILMAISRTSDATGTYDKYVIPVGVPAAGGTTFFTDFDTLGTDDNGVYFGMSIFRDGTTNEYAIIAATPKAPLLAASPSLGPVDAFPNLNTWGAPQAAHSLDAVAPTAPAWFVASASSTGGLAYFSLTWDTAGTPTLSSQTTIVTPTYANNANISAPALGSTVDIDTGDPRAQMAVVRNNRLFTCRTVGVNSTGGNSGADRSGCEWLELSLSGTTAALVQSGRVYDSAATDPWFYYFPSLMVNGQGHLAMGFAGSKSTEYVGAFFTGRLATDPVGTMGSVTQLKAGEAPYTVLASGVNRWGDYSYTSLDPNDGMTLWTIQEYAATDPGLGYGGNWGTYVSRLLAPAPTLDNPGGTGQQGSNTLQLTGTGFYDPGAGYANRLAVQLTGGTNNGISNYNITNSSATSITVTFDIAQVASGGPRDITVTNPDGQSATVANGYLVRANVPESIVFGTETVEGGQPVVATVTMLGIAPAGGLTITLVADSSVATLPPTVTIPENASSVDFTIETQAVARSSPVTIEALANGEKAVSVLNVSFGGGEATGGGGGCFIATAAYGSGLDSRIVALSEFRDGCLLPSPVGDAFTRTYYGNSPTPARFLGRSAALRLIARRMIAPAVVAAERRSGRD